MNAHHLKRSHRPPAPSSISFLSTGSLPVPAVPSPGEVPTGPSEGKRIWQAIAREPFGWQLDVIVPTVGGKKSALPVELEGIVNKMAEFSYCPKVNLADLLEPEFMNEFVRQGSLVALSLGDAEGEDVVCIDGRGRMILSVSKNTYELLGLPGRPSAFGSLGHTFIIEINLRDPAFRSGKPGFTRTKTLLRNWPVATTLFDELAGAAAPATGVGKTFEMVFSFINNSIGPTPITFPSTVSSSVRLPTLSTHTLSSIRVPSKLSASFLPVAVPKTRAKRPRTTSVAALDPTDLDEWHHTTEGLREWLGLVAIGAEDKVTWNVRSANEAEDDDDEGLGVPQAECEEGSATVLSWSGFFHPGLLQSLVLSLSNRKPGSPFLSLSLQSVPHSPISHLSAKSPVPATRKKPNGKRVKRGRGRGEEEEGDASGAGEGRGWELVTVAKGKQNEWCLWESQ